MTTWPEQEPTDPRSKLARRLTEEMGDQRVGIAAADAVDEGTLARLDAATGGDFARSDVLDYTPVRVPAADVDSLWVYSFGFRIDPTSGVGPVALTDVPPPIEVLSPGPVNAELAAAAADFLVDHPMPVIAQWEVARELERLGVDDVISVEPARQADGTVVYLSTPAVAVEGQRMALARGIDVGVAGVLCVADFAVSCVTATERVGLPAAVPQGLTLPTAYDGESGQLWTRSREAWLPVDLLGRGFMARQG